MAIGFGLSDNPIENNITNSLIEKEERVLKKVAIYMC
jgi:hypothetical protein